MCVYRVIEKKKFFVCPYHENVLIEIEKDIGKKKKDTLALNVARASKDSHLCNHPLQTQTPVKSSPHVSLHIYMKRR